MLVAIVREIRRWFFPVLMVTLWWGSAIAIEILPENTGPGEVIALYSNLGQNIEQESDLYSKYTDYRENLRLKVFWQKLEGLNLARDEMILSIRFLERRLEGQRPESAYATTGGFPLSSDPTYLSGLFSHWRPFYFLISGGFFLMITSLPVMVLSITCRREVMTFTMDSATLKKAA